MLASLLFDRFVSEKESARVRFLESRCLRSRFNRNQCRSCLDECQAGALNLDGRTISFNQKTCTMCMRCASVCPNDAFDGGLNLTHLFELLSSSKQVFLTCRDSSHFQQKHIIPCIGFFSEPLLAAMISVALENFFIDIIHCHDCKNNHCMSSFYEKIKNSTDRNEFKKIVPLTKHSEIYAVHSVDKGVARRSYLRFAKKTLTDLGKKAVCLEETNTISSQKHADKRPVAASIFLNYAYKKAPEDAKEVLRSYFYTVKANGLCNLCPGCQGMCPTGALKRVADGEGEKRLMFISSACSGCGLCENFCKRNAIEITPGMTGDPGKPLRIC